MRLLDDQLPAPGPKEVTVAIEAIGLNFADIFAIWGVYSATPSGQFIPGLEYSGTIVAVGDDVRDDRLGERVMGVTRFGAYASHLNSDEDYVLPMPDDWSFAEGAAYLVQVLTAYYALKPLGNLQTGQTVLIHSAAGGVGLWANRIAKQWDAYTIGTVGRAEKLDILQQESYDRGIVRSNNFARDLKEALGDRPLHIILESIGGKIWKIGFEALAPQGRCVIFGSARYASVGKRPNYFKMLYHHFTRPKLDPQQMIQNNNALLGFNLIWLYHQKELMHELLQEIKALPLGRARIDRTFPFNDLPQAILHFQTGKTVGKVIVQVNA